MSTLVEALSVVIPRHVLDAGYPGGTEGYLDTARRARGARYAICDERLACVSFAGPADADAFTAPLSSLGLGSEDGTPPPVACLDEDFGPTAPCPWLRWRRHGDGFTSCWLEWTEPGELATPTDWLPPRQRSAVGRATIRLHAPAPALTDVAPEPPAAPPPLRVPPIAIGPLTPIGSPAILAALASSQSGNGHGQRDDDFPELDGLVAIAERPAGDRVGDTDSTGRTDVVGGPGTDDPDAPDAAGGERWALPEFEPTEMDADVDDDSPSTDVAGMDVAGMDVAGMDVAGMDVAGMDVAGMDFVRNDEDSGGRVDDDDDDDDDDMDAMIAELPAELPAELAMDAASETTPAEEEEAEEEADEDWLTGPAHLSPAVGAAGATHDDETTRWPADIADGRLPVAAEEPAAATVDDGDDYWRPATADGAAMASLQAEEVLATTDASSTGAPTGAGSDADIDDEAAAALASGWTDVFEAAHAAVGAIADAAPATDAAIDAAPPYITGSDSPEPTAEHTIRITAASLPEAVPVPAPFSPAAMTAVATAAPVTIGPSLDAVRAHLAERGWRCSQDVDQGALFYQTAGGRASYPGFAAADESAQLVWLYTQIPVRVPEHRRAAAVELLTRANHGLAVGNFEFDYTDGEVRFKTVADTAGGCFNADAAGRLLRHSLDACDRYHDALMQVIYGGLSAAEAVR
ncbi:MAG: YbjN domain-containing protein [Gemmatimonadaceae bacterium]